MKSKFVISTIVLIIVIATLLTYYFGFKSKPDQNDSNSISFNFNAPDIVPNTDLSSTTKPFSVENFIKEYQEERYESEVPIAIVITKVRSSDTELPDNTLYASGGFTRILGSGFSQLKGLQVLLNKIPVKIISNNDIEILFMLESADGFLPGKYRLEITSKINGGLGTATEKSTLVDLVERKL